MDSAKAKNLDFLVRVGAATVNSHVVTPNGRHSKSSFTKYKLYRHPKKILFVAKTIAQKFKNDKIDAVVGLANGGIALAVLVAHQMEKISQRDMLSLYVEKASDGSFLLRDKSNRELINNKRILLVDDAVNTGKTVQKLGSFIVKLGGNVVGLAVICTRDKQAIQRLKFPKFYSFMVYPDKIDSYPADGCPMCKRKIPINRKFGVNS